VPRDWSSGVGSSDLQRQGAQATHPSVEQRQSDQADTWRDIVPAIPVNLIHGELAPQPRQTSNGLLKSARMACERCGVDGTCRGATNDREWIGCIFRKDIA